ncbi:hypothetical protein LEMLEM_LOCUS16838, partial [Lemmus lemmus]
PSSHVHRPSPLFFLAVRTGAEFSSLLAHIGSSSSTLGFVLKRKTHECSEPFSAIAITEWHRGPAEFESALYLIRHAQLLCSSQPIMMLVVLAEESRPIVCQHIAKVPI